MAHGLAEKLVLEKLQVLYRALDLTAGYRDLARELGRDEGDIARLTERLESWHNGRVLAMRDDNFFETLRIATAESGGSRRRIFREEVTTTNLIDGTVEDFIQYLAPPFQETYARNAQAPRVANGELTKQPVQSGLPSYPQWDQIGELLKHAAQAPDGGPSELRMVMTLMSKEAVPHQKLPKLAGGDVKIRIILARADAALSLDPQLSPGEEIRRLERVKGHLASHGEVRISGTMPYSFLALGTRVAVLGLSGHTGPLIKIEGPESESFLGRLKAEWESHWQDASGGSPSELLSFFAGHGGPFYSRRQARGAIFLQTDTTPAVLRRHVEDHYIPPHARWINATEAEGAQAIIEEFVAHRMEPPALLHVNRHFDRHLEPSFEIVMGRLLMAVRGSLAPRCGRWLRIVRHPKYGTGIALHRDVIQDILPEEQLLLEPWKREQGFQMLVSATGSDGHEDFFRSGYAIILRLTDGPGSVVRWYIAGTTEEGTMGAGRYLARRWHQLYAQHQGRDFFMVVQGVAHSIKTFDWRPSSIVLTQEQMKRL